MSSGSYRVVTVPGSGGFYKVVGDGLGDSYTNFKEQSEAEEVARMCAKAHEAGEHAKAREIRRVLRISHH